MNVVIANSAHYMDAKGSFYLGLTTVIRKQREAFSVAGEIAQLTERKKP
jgi:hypothetical protein